MKERKKKTKDADYYITVVCWHCKHVNKFQIPEGKSASDFTNKVKCEKCGCHSEIK